MTERANFPVGQRREDEQQPQRNGEQAPQMLDLPALQRRLSKVCYVGEEPRAIRPVDMPRLET